MHIGDCPEGLDKSKRKYYRLQAIPYAKIDGVLYKKDFNGVFLRCIYPDQSKRILEEFHDGLARDHFAPCTTTLKIMKAGYYWPDLFKDAHTYVRKCAKCSLFAGKQKLAALPLNPIQVEQPFGKWGLNFIVPINPPSSVGHRWILTATDYFTKWTEAITLRDANGTSVLNFYQDIVSRSWYT